MKKQSWYQTSKQKKPVEELSSPNMWIRIRVAIFNWLSAGYITILFNEQNYSGWKFDIPEKKKSGK